MQASLDRVIRNTKEICITIICQVEMQYFLIYGEAFRVQPVYMYVLLVWSVFLCVCGYVCVSVPCSIYRPFSPFLTLWKP